MENAILAVDPRQVAGVRFRLRLGSVLVALALVFAAVVLVQHRADASPAAPVAVASVAAAVGSAGAAVAPQIDVLALIRAIVCPILAALRAGPFGGFIGPIIQAIQVAFGCIAVSGT